MDTYCLMSTTWEIAELGEGSFYFIWVLISSIAIRNYTGKRLIWDRWKRHYFLSPGNLILGPMWFSQPINSCWLRLKGSFFYTPKGRQRSVSEEEHGDEGSPLCLTASQGIQPISLICNLQRKLLVLKTYNSHMLQNSTEPEWWDNEQDVGEYEALKSAPWKDGLRILCKRWFFFKGSGT